MINTLATSPGTVIDDSTVGTVAWSNPNNAKVSDDIYATAIINNSSKTLVATENIIKIVKADGTIGTVNKSTGATPPSTDTYISYGSSSDLWGETWDYTKINNANFGVVFSVSSTKPSVSHYLKATNFGFSIPSGTVINGILVEIEQSRFQGNFNDTISVDHIRITVYYTVIYTIDTLPASFTCTRENSGIKKIVNMICLPTTYFFTTLSINIIKLGQNSITRLTKWLALRKIK